MKPADMASAARLPAGIDRQVVGVVATDGGDMAEALFAIESEGDISVMLRNSDDRERIEALGVSEIVTPDPSSGWVTPATVRTGPADAPARIVYSSGTTGKPKAVLVTHGNITSTADRLIAEMEMDASIREYIGVPLTYSFGLARARVIAQLGGSYYVPPHGFDPSEIVDLLRSGDINAISAVPTLWRVLIANADLLGTLGERVRWIEIGSQAMSADEKRAMRALFPNARIVQHYGLTEASRATFLSIDRCSDEELASVGHAGRGTEVEIGADGLIRIRGTHVAPWKLEDGVWQPLAGADGWLTTGDLGHMSGGALYFDGRADDLINCGGTKLSPDGVERAIAKTLALTAGQADCIGVSRTPDALRGEAVLVAYEHGAGLDASALRDAAMAALAEQGLTVGNMLKLVEVDALPRTATGKLLRRELATAVRDEHVAAPATPSAPEPVQAEAGDDIREQILTLWRSALGRDDVDPDKSFYDVGGDSLSAITLALSMERAGFDPDTARSIFEGRTISQIATALAPKSSPPAAATADDGAQGDVQERLLALWRSALGRDDVDPDKSFYDVGGDSLSAISLALNMERAGFDPDTARSIFEGRTVNEIAAAVAPAPNPGAEEVHTILDDPLAPDAPHSGYNPVAMLSEGLNLMKGWLILWMVASHWLPFYLGRAGLRDSAAHKAMQPFLSMGSPTLAFCFGIGASVFYARQYRASKTSFRRSIRTGGLLLLAGLLIGVAAEVGAHASRGDRITIDILAEAIAGGPFLYFLLATLSLPLWVGRIDNSLRSAWWLFGGAIAMSIAYQLLRIVLAAGPDDVILQSIERIVVGHWSLMLMGAISLAGAGAGVIIEMMIARRKPLSQLAPIGVLMIGAGIAMALAAKDFLSWFEPHENIIPWAVVSYVGMTLYAIGRIETWKRALQTRIPVRTAMETLLTLGVLLFPIYIVQSVVYHGSVIVSRLSGVSFLTVLTGMIAIWAVITAYMVMRMQRLYYGRTKAA